MKTVLVKLGGAALTNKQTTCTLSPNFDDLVEQISKIYHLNKSRQIQTIFIHGAGAFGHPQAKQYQVKHGWIPSSATTIDSDNIKFGMTVTRQSVLLLHNQLLERLQNHGVPVVSLSPFDHVQTSGGGEFPTESSTLHMVNRVKYLLKLGFTPLLHGDAVLDDQLGCTILSGDVIMHQLATYFNKGNNNDDIMNGDTIERCVFVTDVKGIYTSDPKVAKINNHAVSLIKHIPVFLNNDLHPVEYDQNNNTDDKIADVSGGIQGKVKWAKRVIMDSNVAEVIICKAGSPEVAHSITLEPIDLNSPSINQLFLTVFTKHEL